ncbi:hypothetical protein E2I00_008196, partial [Balaenoptera physalus]
DGDRGAQRAYCEGVSPGTPAQRNRSCGAAHRAKRHWMRPDEGSLLGRAAASRVGSGAPLGRPRRGSYSPLPHPEVCSESGLLAFGRHGGKHRDLAKAVLRRKRMLGAAPNRPDSSGKRSVKFNKGYTALTGIQILLRVNQDVSRQLLQDGYHLDEIPDDEDLDLIPPKPMTSSTCSCCWCCLRDASFCTLQ